MTAQSGIATLLLQVSVVAPKKPDISGVTALNNGSIPATVHVTAIRDGADPVEFDAALRIDTPGEAGYYRNGGILPYVLRVMARKTS
jgi:aconitate hydratase